MFRTLKQQSVTLTFHVKTEKLSQHQRTNLKISIEEVKSEVVLIKKFNMFYNNIFTF